MTTFNCTCKKINNLIIKPLTRYSCPWSSSLSEFLKTSSTHADYVPKR